MYVDFCCFGCCVVDFGTSSWNTNTTLSVCLEVCWGCHRRYYQYQPAAVALFWFLRFQVLIAYSDLLHWISAQCELFVHFVPAFFEVRIFACGDYVRHIVLLKQLLNPLPQSHCRHLHKAGSNNQLIVLLLLRPAPGLIFLNIAFSSFITYAIAATADQSTTASFPHDRELQPKSNRANLHYQKNRRFDPANIEQQHRTMEAANIRVTVSIQ